MDLKPIQLAADYDGVSTKKDGSVSIRISTQELTPIQKMQTMEYVGLHGWFLFSPNKFEEVDVPKEGSDADANKTPSKRLRASLFVLWQQKKVEEDFESYYKRQMEKIIETVKARLE